MPKFTAERTPRQKANAVRPAYLAYAHEMGGYDDDVETGASDMIADLLHLVAKEGGDAEDCARRALMHFTFESAPRKERAAMDSLGRMPIIQIVTHSPLHA